MNLTISKTETAHQHDNRFKKQKPKPEYLRHLGRYYIDISSLAVRPQHKVRYLYVKRGVKLEIDFLCLVDTKTSNGWFRFIPHKAKGLKQIVNEFVETVGIDKDQIFHDKSFLFGFGVSYCGVSLMSQKHKQKIEHHFSFKRWIYEAYEKGEIKTAKDLFEKYRHYLKTVKGFVEI